MRSPRRWLLLRGSQLVTSYRAGFEDCLYDHVYRNPFPVNSAEWHSYDSGNADARTAIQTQKGHHHVHARRH